MHACILILLQMHAFMHVYLHNVICVCMHALMYLCLFHFHHYHYPLPPFVPLLLPSLPLPLLLPSLPLNPLVLPFLLFNKHTSMPLIGSV